MTPGHEQRIRLPAAAVVQIPICGGKMMEIRFRECTIEDLPELCAFSRDVFYESFRDDCSPEDMEAFLRDRYSADRIRNELLNPDSAFGFLYLDGGLSGYIKINEAPAQTDINDEKALEVERLYVSGEAQGRGLGSFLLEQAAETAKQRGKKYIWLGVWEKNLKAISFYRKHGFREIGTHTFMIGADAQTDYIMRKDLQA